MSPTDQSSAACLPPPMPAARAAVRRDLGLAASGLVAADPVFLQLLDRIERVAATQATVLLLGESGTGKELVARFLHASSPRRTGSFVALNCAAIPDALLESMLFGHDRGAFTGAHRAQMGRFEQADGGTLFLDEVGELSLAAQAKLLRVLQERRVERLGDGRAHALDLRLVAATNVNLDLAVREGRFREDLYYRLAVFPVRVPSLRERPLDIPVLARHFIARYAAEFGLATPALDQRLLDALQGHSWPGNVRELENLVQRALLLAGGETLGLAHLELETAGSRTGAAPAAVHDVAASQLPGTAASAAMTPRAAAPAALNVRDAERQHILHVLAQVKGNRRAAVAALGISERALRYKLKSYRESGHLGDTLAVDPWVASVNSTRNEAA